MTIATLIVDVAANTVKLQQDVNKIQGSLDGVGAMAGKLGGILAGAFTVTAITGAASKMLDYASTISDLSAQTGLSTRAIQEMSHAAKMTGTSVEAFTNAAFKLGTNLAGGGGSVQAAVEKLGLSYYHLRQQSPDQQFDLITEALGHVENAQDRNKLAVELFGKSAKEILPAIDQGYRNIADGATVAGDAQIQALDALGDNVDKFFGYLTAYSTNVFGYLIGAAHDVAKVFSIPFKEVGALFSKLSDAVGFFAASAGPLPKTVQSVADKMAMLPKPLGDVNLSIEEQERRMKALETQHGRVVTSTRKWTQAAEDAKTVGLIWGDGLSDFDHIMADNNLTLIDSIDHMQGLAVATEDVWEQFHRLTGQVQTIGPALLQSTMNLSTMWEPFKAGLTDAKASVKGIGATMGQSIKANLAGVLATIPATLAKAFEGGGDVWGAVKSIGSQVGSAVGSGIGFAMGGPQGQAIGAALGSLVGPALEGFKRLFGIGMSAAQKEAAAAIKKANEALMADMRNQVAGFQSDLQGLIGKAGELGYTFNAAGDVIGIKFDKMRAVADKYKTDLASLGPAFQSNRLHESAQTLIDDFWLLVHGGADVGGVLLGMSPQINALVNDSIKFGTVIPENMKPWIQSLLDAGMLTDANGVKVTDLSGIQFGAPIEAQYLTIQSAIADLIAKIDALITRMAAIPSNVTTTVTTVHDDVYSRRGGDNSDVGPGFATGSGGIRDFGNGTLAVLHGRERVQTESQMRGEQARGGGDDSLLRQLIRDLPRAMKLAVDDAMVLRGAH